MKYELTLPIRTATIYGHPLHVYHADAVLRDKAISKAEYGSLVNGRYVSALFSGCNMSDTIQERGYDINMKVHLHAIKNDDIVFDKFLTKAIVRMFNCSPYDVTIFKGKVELSNQRAVRVYGKDNYTDYLIEYEIIGTELRVKAYKQSDIE